MGDKVGYDEAKRIILDLISGPTEVFEIPRDMRGVVFGKGGSKLKEIKSETGVIINVGSRDSAVNGMIEVCLYHICGDKQACGEAKMIIMVLVYKMVFMTPKNTLYNMSSPYRSSAILRSLREERQRRV